MGLFLFSMWGRRILSYLILRGLRAKKLKSTVLKSAGKSKLKKKTEFRRQETEEEPDPRYWILDAGHPWKRRTKGLKEFSLAEPQ